MCHEPNEDSTPAAGLTDTYFEFVKRRPLTTIRSEAELDSAQEVLDALLPLDADEGGLAYVDALSDLVIVSEFEHHAMIPLPPDQLLAHMLKERNMSQADLVRATGLAKATVSDLVGGKRSSPWTRCISWRRYSGFRELCSCPDRRITGQP